MSATTERAMMNDAEFANIASAEEHFWWYRGMRKVLDAALDRAVEGRRMARVLDAGCGTGYNARLFETAHGWTMFPVDLAWEGLRYGNSMGVERLAQADIASLPFPSEVFDAVISLEVIVHFPKGQEFRAAKEMARVLAPKGLLVLRVSALDVLRSHHSAFACERQRFTRSRLVELVRGCGIRVLRCTYANSLLLPIALAKFRLWEPLTRRPAESGVRPVAPWLDRLLYCPLALESAWIRAGLNFPLGQSLVLIGEKVP